jgi:hypothetical protein
MPQEVLGHLPGQCHHPVGQHRRGLVWRHASRLTPGITRWPGTAVIKITCPARPHNALVRCGLCDDLRRPPSRPGGYRVSCDRRAVTVCGETPVPGAGRSGGSGPIPAGRSRMSPCRRGHCPGITVRLIRLPASGLAVRWGLAGGRGCGLAGGLVAG